MSAKRWIPEDKLRIYGFQIVTFVDNLPVRSKCYVEL